ncbi:MAG: VWA domain-containing protein [Firmicutes bacterium]|nr:VWA domain-containing protein [Bacillota bacterium]
MCMEQGHGHSGCGCHGHGHGHSHGMTTLNGPLGHHHPHDDHKRFKSMDDYIENHIITFIHILRNSGLNIGISEIMDALKVLSVLDLTDRSQVYSGLASVLAKSDHDARIFDEAFQAYFVPEDIRMQQMAQYMAKRQQREELREQLQFQEQQMDVSEKDLDTYTSMSEKQRERIRDFLEKASNGVNMTPDHKTMVEQQLQGVLQRQRDKMWQQQIMPLETTGVEEWDAILYDVNRNRDDEELLLKNIGEIREEEMQEAVVLIRQLARKIATRIGRRYRNSSGRKTVDVRKSIRGALRYGGVLMQLKYKRRRVQKPQVILIADVSGSMLKYSSFLLELMYGLSAVLPNIRSYIFAERLKRLDLRTFDIDSFTQDSEVGDGTNLNNSLLEFWAECDKILNKKTVLIILSDTKTVEYQQAALQLSLIRRRVKDILWLNPIHAEDWGRFSQTKAFLPYVSMFEASSIHNLTKALKDI